MVEILKHVRIWNQLHHFELTLGLISFILQIHLHYFILFIYTLQYTFKAQKKQ